MGDNVMFDRGICNRWINPGRAELLLYRAIALVLMFVSLPGALVQAQPERTASAAKPSYLTIDSTVGELLDNPAAKAVLQSEIPVIANSPKIDQARDISLVQMARYAPTVLTREKLAEINAALAKAPGAISSGRPLRKSASQMDPRDDLTLKTERLWKGEAPGALGNRPRDIPTLTVVTPGALTNFGTAVIVAPGGGYQTLATSLEGRQVADWFAAHGVTAFVLTYRLVTSDYAHPT